MPTEKRQRQKEGRRARLEAMRRIERRRRAVRRVVWVVVIAAVVTTLAKYGALVRSIFGGCFQLSLVSTVV